MTTTTEHSLEPESPPSPPSPSGPSSKLSKSSPPSQSSPPDAGHRTVHPDGVAPPRHAPRLIQTEATTEIPVHLLFRDDPGTTVAAGAARTTGAGAAGVTGATGGMARMEAAYRAGAAGAAGSAVSAASVPLAPVSVREPRTRPVRRTAPEPRPVAPSGFDDPELSERPARVLPGILGVFAGTAGAAGALCTSWWAGALPPVAVHALGLPAVAGAGLGPVEWAAYAGAGALGLFGFGGLARGRTGRAWVLGLFGRYRGTVRRTGLLWVNPLLLRRKVDVRLRHWRGEPLPARDPEGVALRVVTMVVWRVRDTARAVLGVEDHESYLRACVESALARVPVRTHVGEGAQDAGTDPEDGEVLTRVVAAEAAPVGLEVFSVRPVRVEYAPEVAAAMHRRRIAALDARYRASVLSSVVDSVEDTVTRLTTRGLVELDDYERKVLVKDLTVAFCAGRGETQP